MTRWRFLGLERPRLGARFRWRDRILASAGLALGVLFVLLSWGLLTPAHELIERKVLGSLPDRLRAVPASLSVGPLAMASSISEADAKAAQALPGVAEVFRQARFPEPCHASATYLGKTLYTDLVLEACDPGQVEGDVASGYRFEDPGPQGEIPMIMPSYILDLVNSGIAVNTDLPSLSRDAVIGKHATLYLGTSSFKPGPARQIRCVIVGVSDQVGAGGPVIPYDAAVRLSNKPPEIHALTLRLADPGNRTAVVQGLTPLGLRAPRLELAERITSVVTLLKLLGLLFPGAILVVTALGLGALLELQISKERSVIALYAALGASPAQIGGLYLLRAVSVAVTGWLLGVLGGLAAGQAIALTLQARLPADLLQGTNLFAPPWVALVGSFVFCLAVCLAAGWIPAQRAAGVDPAQVFREPG